MAKRDKQTRSKATGWSDDTASAASNNPMAAALAAAGLTPAAPAPGTPAPGMVPAASAESTAPAQESAPARPPARAVVRLERKGRGGKQATLITHLGLGPDALERWCTTMRKQLGCGGAVEDDTIALQGDQRERAVAWLSAQGIKQVTRG